MDHREYWIHLSPGLSGVQNRSPKKLIQFNEYCTLRKLFSVTFNRSSERFIYKFLKCSELSGGGKLSNTKSPSTDELMGRSGADASTLFCWVSSSNDSASWSADWFSSTSVAKCSSREGYKQFEPLGARNSSEEKIDWTALSSFLDKILGSETDGWELVKTSSSTGRGSSGTITDSNRDIISSV